MQVKDLHPSDDENVLERKNKQFVKRDQKNNYLKGRGYREKLVIYSKNSPKKEKNNSQFIAIETTKRYVYECDPVVKEEYYKHVSGFQRLFVIF